ncbi:NAD(P)H-dependent oxidoreductase [Enterococcus sp. BWT-B8]|uniref:NAD(P)H-dependent oxidoreductase n=1 Tax=Enterococcus sp. BWT-B8 TaxID=2885157 RepID=UPI001E53E614|nr:NAD(P)H-dependent oxidoreductase [Enterococcus sp. BWT-B8]MCB5950675.1 NAD(P)H-dependent oxidoreductase [Enterococcus sp. BWT-B8]
MNILVINGHPDKESFCTAITEQYLSSLDTAKHTVKSIHLYKMSFDPVLRLGYRERMAVDRSIEYSQELLLWADHLVFIYPIWWSSMPSLMKGWIDRVFTPGIAYSSNNKGSFLLNFLTGRQFKKYLKGKTAEIITTSMAPNWWYKIFSGFLSVPDSYGVAVLKNAVLNHCGIKTKKVMVLGEMGRETNTLEIREKFLGKVSQRAFS